MYKEINKLKYNGTEYHIVGVQGPMGPKMTWDDLTDEQKESLKGPQGLQGIQGEIGPQGPKGDKGDQGEQGIQGEIGPQGPAGVVPNITFSGEVNNTVGTPTIEITKETSPNKNSVNFKLTFGGLKGKTGPKGDKGDQGEQGPKGLDGQHGDWEVLTSTQYSSLSAIEPNKLYLVVANAN